MANSMRKSRTETKLQRGRRRRRRVAAAVTILFALSSLPQHATTLAADAVGGHEENNEFSSRNLAEQHQRRRIAERRRLVESQWTSETISKVQTLDYVLDETDTSNVPKVYIRLRDGLLVSPTDGDDNVVPHVDEDITTLEDSDFESLSGGGEDGEFIHHQKPRLPPTNGGHLQIWSQYQQQGVENSGRNLRGRSSSSGYYPDDSQPNSPNAEVEEIAFIYDEDDPEEDDELEGYDIGDTQQQRELSLADAFVSQTKEEPKGKPQGQSSCLPSGKALPEKFHSVFPCSGSKIGNLQAFGVRIDTNNAEAENVSVYLQLKDCKRKRSSWKRMPASEHTLEWFFKELAGFEKCDHWSYRTMLKDESRRRQMTTWIELVIDIERDTPNPTPLPTSSNPTPLPSPEPTSPPSPLPTPGPTLPPSPKPTPWPTPPPSPQPTPHPIDSSGQWTENPTKPPTSKPPTKEPTPSPTNEPTAPPTNPPTPPPSPQPSSPPTPHSVSPTPQPTTPPSPEQATSLQRYVRDDPWEHGGKYSYFLHVYLVVLFPFPYCSFLVHWPYLFPPLSSFIFNRKNSIFIRPCSILL